MNAPQMNDLDHLLGRSAPPSAPDGPGLDAAIGALVDEARAASTPRRPWRRRAVWAGAAAAVIGLGGAGAVAVLPDRPVEDEPFMLPAQEWEALPAQIEWVYTDADGYRCAMRLVAFDLTDAQETQIRARLSAPAALLAADGGAVRVEFMDRYDEDERKQQIADRETWESWVDAAYDEVARLDLAAGSDALDGVPLTMTHANETFDHAYTRLILDGLASDTLDPVRELIPDSACEVGE